MLEEASLEHEDRTEIVMSTHTRHRLVPVLVAAGCLICFAPPALAQQGPPVPGATGVVTPEGGGNGATDAIGAAAGKAVEGTHKLLRGVGIGKDEKHKDVDPLEALPLGTKVVIRYGGGAANAVHDSDIDQKTTEGTVIDIDRKTRVIVVRLVDRTTEKLRLDAAAGHDPDRDVNATPAASGTVSLSYVDASGDKLVLSFRKVP
jgi:hypothetical protein